MPRPVIIDTPYWTDESRPHLKKSYRKEILDRIEELFGTYMKNHNKAFFFRHDVHFPIFYPQYKPDNSIFEHYIENLTNYFDSQALQPAYLWVRESGEQGESGHHHYHIIFLLLGSQIQDLYYPIQAAKKYWALALDIPDADGYVNDCTRDRFGRNQENGIKIVRHSPDYQSVLHRCKFWSQYIAKAEGKSSDLLPKYVRCFNSSRLQ